MLSVKIFIIPILIVAVVGRPASNIMRDLIMNSLNKPPVDQQATSALLQVLTNQLEVIRPLLTANLLQNIFSRSDSGNKPKTTLGSSKTESKISLDNVRKQRALSFGDYFDLFGDLDEDSDEEEEDYFQEKFNCTQTLLDAFLNNKFPIALVGCCSETTTKGNPSTSSATAPSPVTVPASTAAENPTELNVPSSSSMIPPDSASTANSTKAPMSQETLIQTESPSIINIPSSTEQVSLPVSKPSGDATDITEAPVITDPQPSDGAASDPQPSDEAPPVEPDSPPAVTSSQETPDETAPESEPEE